MVVARLAKRFVIVVGSGKCVSKLGETNAAGRPGRIPVEVVPFAEIFVSRGLARLGLTPEPWNIDGIRGLTDNGNHILDCLTGPIDNPSDLDRAIRALPGVVGTGFFLGMAERVLEGDDSFRLVAEYVRGSA
jgi:ribose 5-phosphate isomerase A